eukprot:1352305-Alexandrium_andersonii.AAC.1
MDSTAEAAGAVPRATQTRSARNCPSLNGETRQTSRRRRPAKSTCDGRRREETAQGCARQPAPEPSDS